MSLQVELMRKVLAGLSEEVEGISEQVKTKGIVPREICELCKEENRRNIVDFSLKERKGLLRFREWLAEMKIIAVSQSIMGRTFFKTSSKLGGSARSMKPEAIDESGYVYALPDLHDTRSKKSRIFSKYPKMLGFLSKIDKIVTCPHFVGSKYDILKIESFARERIRYNIYDELPPNLARRTTPQYELFLCCDVCKELKENTMCDNVRKRGFLFDYHCALDDIVLRKRLSQNGLTYESLDEKEQTNEYEPQSPFADWIRPIYYLRQNSTVICPKQEYGIRARGDHLLDIVKYLKPELLVAFDDCSNLPSYLEFQTNILFHFRNGEFFYDKNREPEKDIQKICEKIANYLNAYIERGRGKEHGRIISAMCSIGQELGFIPQQEYSKSGIRIDCVWLDTTGKIQVAVEVETSSTYKKDLISTWKVEPKLAVIVGDAKSDKVTENLMELSLMKSIPHFVLYINEHTEHAFLFDKQEVVKFYDLRQNEGETKKPAKAV